MCAKPPPPPAATAAASLRSQKDWGSLTWGIFKKCKSEQYEIINGGGDFMALQILCDFNILMFRQHIQCSQGAKMRQNLCPVQESKMKQPYKIAVITWLEHLLCTKPSLDTCFLE